jgi:hypothetical protein
VRVVLVAAALLLAGCGPAGGAPAAPPAAPPTPTVTGRDVAQSVYDQLAATVGTPPDAVSCPDLAARVGAVQRCTLTSGGAIYGVTVTVTAVEGADVRFDVRVDPQPR